MRKILVFQHVAHEILGTLNPLLKKHGFRVKYVNFDRSPDTKPSLDRYNGLIVLGGHMGVYESDRYAHIAVEMKLLEEALKKDIPILGICLGAQLLAHALGAPVRKHRQKEIGWHEVHFTEQGASDPLFRHFKKTEKLFQMHGDTFEIPKDAKHLAWSEICPGQAFRYGEKVYGIQFHLEADRAMIHRWLKVPANVQELIASDPDFSIDQIAADTEDHIAQSVSLSRQTFFNFIQLFGLRERAELLGTDHAKPIRRE